MEHLVETTVTAHAYVEFCSVLYHVCEECIVPVSIFVLHRFLRKPKPAPVPKRKLPRKHHH